MTRYRLKQVETFTWMRAHRARTPEARRFWFHVYDVANGLLDAGYGVDPIHSIGIRVIELFNQKQKGRA